MSDETTVDPLEHTHDDGTTHSHDGGDEPHNHDEVPAFNLADLAAVKQIIEDNPELMKELENQIKTSFAQYIEENIAKPTRWLKQKQEHKECLLILINQTF